MVSSSINQNRQDETIKGVVDWSSSTLLLSLQANEERLGWLFPPHPPALHDRGDNAGVITPPTSVCRVRGDMDRIRAIPEIMLQVYSFLPIYDRVYQLALVDRAFARDRVRGGFICAMYGGRYSLMEALDKFDCFIKASIDQTREEKSDIPIDLLLRRWRLERLVSTRDKIPGMKSRVKLTTSLYEAFDPKVRRCSKPHWLDDIVNMRMSLKRFHTDGEFNRLASLIQEEDCVLDFAIYETTIRTTQSKYLDKVGLPRLDPGCTLHLPDPDVGLTEHKAVSCSICSKVTWYANCHVIRCRHGRSGYCCATCDAQLFAPGTNTKVDPPSTASIAAVEAKVCSFCDAVHSEARRRQQRVRSRHSA